MPRIHSRAASQCRTMKTTFEASPGRISTTAYARESVAGLATKVYCLQDCRPAGRKEDYQQNCSRPQFINMVTWQPGFIVVIAGGVLVGCAAKTIRLSFKLDFESETNTGKYVLSQF